MEIKILHLRVGWALVDVAVDVALHAFIQELLCLEGDASCFFVCPSATHTTLMSAPAADAWREGAPAPRLRLRHAAAAALGGELMVVLGGRDADDAIVRAVDVYNATVR